MWRGKDHFTRCPEKKINCSKVTGKRILKIIVMLSGSVGIYSIANDIGKLSSQHLEPNLKYDLT